VCLIGAVHGYWRLESLLSRNVTFAAGRRNARLQSRRVPIQRSDLRDWSRAFRKLALVRVP